MKTLVLIKSHPCIQLAHLYEHLFLSCIDSLLRQKGLQRSLDYSTTGLTHENSIIYIEASLYTKSAEAVIDELPLLRLSFEKDYTNISRALLAMSAELTHELKLTDKRKLVSDLKKLDQEPWQNLDALQQFDTKGIRRKSSPIHLTSRLAKRPSKLYIHYTLSSSFKKEYPELIYLYLRLIHFIDANLTHLLSETYGYYEHPSVSTRDATTFKSPLLVSPLVENEPNLTNISSVLQDELTNLTSDATFKLIIDEINKISYTNHFNESPDPLLYLHETGRLIGALGWKELATIPNLQTILACTTIRVSYKKQSMGVL